MCASLKGRTVLITREQKQAQIFAKQIVSRGGVPLEAPLLRIQCTCTEAKTKQHVPFNQYDWLFFTSANGVHCFFQAVQAYGVDLSVLKNVHIAAVGPKTDAAIQAYGLKSAFIPSVYNADTMTAEFLPQAEHKSRILLIQGNWSRQILPDFFTAQSLEFDVLEAYETSIDASAADNLNAVLKTKRIDFLTFTSPSTVSAFVSMADQMLYSLEDDVCVCIGTTTEHKARALGFKHILTPKQFTIDGMLNEMTAYIERMEDNG
ncbi:uroporphyrinogen-III synthase [Lentibacillus saliphilus]|uniref:uroporphyrinogen-III synthase n=1 Tax=Lentibacillus saliphilus TaxID=2737028 RepID=UPI001C310672|nr:uroporphyrinogen-III synthase [Lentibacillus saliphilus]